MRTSQPFRSHREGRCGLPTLLIAVLVLLVSLGWYTASSWLLSAALCVPLLGVCAWLYRGGNPLVGPLLRIDLVRTARHGRLFLFRSGYALALLVVLYLLYARWFPDSLGLSWNLAAGPRIPLADSARFAESFFQSFLLAQLAAVFLFTPAYVAGVIAEEKDRRTLDYLLVSDLTDREIVFSKLASRLLHLSLLIFLTGLPVLMFLTFLGGIAPELVVAGFLANGFTMLSIAGTSLLCSVYAERTLTAMFGAYLLAAGQLFSCGTCCLPLLGPTLYAPVALLFQAGPVLTICLSSMLHGWIAAVCCHWAILRMRPWYRIRASGPARSSSQAQSEFLAATNRPEISDDPLWWKERHGSLGINWSPETRAFHSEVAYPLVVTALLFFILAFGIQHLIDLYHNAEITSRLSREIVSGLYTVLLSSMLLTTAVRAACSIGRERDRQTWDGLLMLPWDNREILAAKWWACFWSPRRGLLLALLCLFGFISSGGSILSTMLLAFAGIVYLTFAASLGLWLSLACATTLRAINWTLVILFTAGLVPLAFGPGYRTTLSPPAALLTACRYFSDLDSIQSLQAAATFQADRVGLRGGLVLYGGMASVLWLLTNQRFGPITGRMPIGRELVPTLTPGSPPNEDSVS